MSNRRSTQHAKQRVEQGNVFIIILVAIALFAALSFTVMRSDNSKSENLLNDRKAELAASEIMEYAQSITNGVVRVRNRNSCTDDMISFEPPPFNGTTAYNNTKAPSDKTCHIFHPQGGAVAHRTFPKAWSTNDALSVLTPVFTGSSCIPSVGTGDAASCMGNTQPSDSELLMIIDELSPNLCAAINKNLNTHSGTVSIHPDKTPFNGTYTDVVNGMTNLTHMGNHYTGVESACWSLVNHGTFYKVLLAR